MPYPRTVGAREQMIEATERLVAEQGLSALSLRTVQAEARQRNKSAAQYHFGSRAGLIEAVARSRMAAVNERRSELLAAVAGPPDDPAELMEVLVRPLAEATATGTSHWARFLAQCGTDPTLASTVRNAVEGRAYRATARRLTDSLVHLPESLRARRVEHAVGLAVTSLAAAEARTGPRPFPFETELEDLVAMCTAVVTAPAPRNGSKAEPLTEDLSCTP